ncbi:MAG: molybdopterin-binding protein [Methylococcales bacterium]|nr:molybdopterin-binding protein [Methylococcales bacterium]
MNPTLEIFSQGEEIVTGQTVDTNAAWLAQEAIHCGFTVTRHTAVGDKLTDLINLLNDIAARADCCICTGGLGPTSDDLTAEAVASAFNRPLEFDDIAFEQIKEFFDRRNRPMPEVNKKQALLPQTAKRIDNTWGTAPGFALQHQRCWFVFLPGVPSEMKGLFLEHVKPDLLTRFTLQPPHLVSLKTLGVGESAIQELIKDIKIPETIELGFRAGTDDVQTKLLFPFDYPKTDLDSLVAEFSQCLGDYVFAIDGLEEPTGDLAFEINKLMTATNHTLAIIETASHGLLAAKCVGYDWLIQASYDKNISQSNQVLSSSELLNTAKNLALNLQEKTDGSLVLVQLYTGKPEALKDKNLAIQVLTVLRVDKTFYESIHTILGPITRKQNQAALLSLDLLRRYLK